MEKTAALGGLVEETKICLHCKKTISQKATRCPYCQSDLRSWLNRHPILGFTLLIILSLFVLGLLGSINSSGTDTSEYSVSTDDSSTEHLSNITGIPVSDINAAFPIAARHGLSTTTQGIVVNESAGLYALKTKSKYGPALAQAGMGSFESTTDTLAHLVSAWNIEDSEIATSSSALFAAMTNGNIPWNELTDTLIENGPKMADYATFPDVAVSLAVLSSQTGLTNETIISTFNSIANSTQDPNTPMNQYLGGTGSVRALVSQADGHGLITIFQKIAELIQTNQSL